MKPMVDEIPVVFACEGSRLLGMVHRPHQLRSRGLLMVVAGGPQFRVGVCRMQVQMARDLAAQGVPVMRFDYRGLGDSEGQFQGFCHVGADLAAAVRAFQQQVPGMTEVVLWGGCDAASASLIHGWKLPQVTGLVLGNPWVHSDSTSDAVAVKHYGQRMRDKDFWLKLLKLQYNPVPAALTLARTSLGKLSARPHTANEGDAAQDDPALPFQTRMRIGLSNFKGDVLLLMSGRSLLSKEFDELVAAHPTWQQAMHKPRQVSRVDIADADQAFSTIGARAEVTRITGEWLLSGQPPASDAARWASPVSTAEGDTHA